MKRYKDVEIKGGIEGAMELAKDLNKLKLLREAERKLDAMHSWLEDIVECQPDALDCCVGIYIDEHGDELSIREGIGSFLQKTERLLEELKG